VAHGPPLESGNPNDYSENFEDDEFVEDEQGLGGDNEFGDEGDLAGAGEGDGEGTDTDSEELEIDLLGERLDIDEEPLTGATIALPSGLVPNYNPSTRMITASLGGGKVSVFFKFLNQRVRNPSKFFNP
jgi:hypothetical protein